MRYGKEKRETASPMRNETGTKVPKRREINTEKRKAADPLGDPQCK